ncbi:hypothetical protein [Nonlabens sp.]|uniref:hypothetical protein n=1 Tax=Nonlabens sp. TaxID=1888209 RepID=UPI001BCB0523|nr:hypothetical protein [Nonlabens sp.]
MKKVLLTFALIAGTAFTANSQCGDNASPISSSCWSGCVSVYPPLTGFLEIDARGPRKPNATEYAEAQGILDSYCNR